MNEELIFKKCAQRLIPFAMVLYVVNYIDRVNVGFAALTMNKDLGFSAEVFGFGGSIFFVGYLLFQMPANLVMVRVGARRWIFTILFVWGFVSAANAFIQGPLTYYAMRFILGVAEAGFFPGMLLYMTFWFPQSWRARFMAGFMAAIPLANIIGGPLSTHLLQLENVAGLHGWQWMFIIEGLPASLLALAALKFLPDGPDKADWLSAEEKQIIAARLAREDTSEHHDLWPALFDIRVWFIGLVLLCNQLSLYGVQLFLPLIIKDMGYDNIANGWIVSACFIVGMVVMIWWGLHSDAKRERIWHVAISLIVAAAGLSIAAIAHSNIVMLMALALAMVGTLSYNGPFFSLPSTFLAGTAAAGGVGLINTIGSFGRIIGPGMMGAIKEATGDYSMAMVVLALGMVLGAVVVLALGRNMAARKLKHA